MMYTPEQIRIARINLTNFVEYKAREVAAWHGFGWVACDPAPSTLETLLEAWEHSKRTKEALPVWSGASDNTIYTHALGNWAFRFWHDAIHCKYGIPMETVDEIAIGACHVLEVAEVFGHGSLEARLMYWDTIGQSIHEREHGQFPPDQLQFALDNIQKESV